MEKQAIFDLSRQLKPKDHVIMFYDYAEDKHRALLEYLKACLDEQEAVAYVAGIDETPSQVRSLLQKRGINVDVYETKGMLKLMSYKDWYLIDGKFNVQRTIALWARLLNDTLKKGFRGLRVVGDVTWFLKGDMKEELLEYENSLHRVLDMPMIGICAYSLPVLMQKNQVQLVVDLIKAHNNVIFLGSQAGLVKAEKINNLTPQIDNRQSPSAFHD